MRERIRLSVVVAAVAVVAGLVACTDGESAGAPRRGGVFRMGISRVGSLDPAQARTVDQLFVADQLFDGLTEADPRSGAAQPGLADRWTSSDDLRQWDFELRSEARFANGRPITPADVKYSLERVARKGAGSPAADLLELVSGFFAYAVDGTAPELTGVSVLSPRIVRITLDQGWSVLPLALSNPALGVVPREAVDAPPPAPRFDEQPLGSGPFRIEAIETDRISMVPRPGAEVHPDRLDLLQFASDAASYQRFVAGDLDFSRVPPDQVETARRRFGDANFRPLAAVLFYGFNLRSPKLTDVRVREAIVRAVDRDAIVNAIYHGTVIPARGVVVQGVADFQADPCGPLCNFAPDRSRSLLREVYGDAPAPEFFIDVDADPSQEAVGRAMQSSLAKVGITATLRPRPLKEYQDFVATGQQEIFRLGWIGAYPSADAFLAPLFAKGSPSNLTGFDDADVDQELQTARQEGASARRTELYRAAERTVMTRLPVLPIAQFETHAVVSKRVRGLRLSVMGSFDAGALWLAA